MARYVELIVHGDDRDLVPYLTGYVAASGSVHLVFAHEAGFHIKQLRERFRHHGEVQHVIVEASQAPRVRDALAAAAPRYKFEIKGERTLASARFAFSFDTPSRKVAEALKTLLAKLPAGAALADYVPQEVIDPKAVSAEMYAPEHDYRFTGRGRAHGEVFAIAELRAALCAIDFTDCEEIEVDTA